MTTARIPARTLPDLYRRLAATHDAPTRDRLLDEILDHPDYTPPEHRP